MQPLDLITACLRQFRLRPLESALIVLVVALAVGIETVMLAVVFNKLAQERALSQSVEARSFVVGALSNDYRSFYTSAGINPVFTVGATGQSPVTLEEADLQKTLEACPALRSAFLADYSGIQEPSGATGARAPLVNLLAVSPAYIEATGLTLLAGSWPSAGDFRDRKRVIALSNWFAVRRFGSGAASAQEAGNQSAARGSATEFSLSQVIGQTMRSVSGSSYVVVGVFATPQLVTAREEFRFVNEWQSRGVVGLMPWGIEDFSLSSVRELKFVAKEGQVGQARSQLSAYYAKRFGSRIIINAARDQITASFDGSRSTGGAQGAQIGFRQRDFLRFHTVRFENSAVIKGVRIAEPRHDANRATLERPLITGVQRCAVEQQCQHRGDDADAQGDGDNDQ